MKFIRFVMRDGAKYTFEMDKGQKILTSPQQLVMVSEEDGGWDGFSINKADVMKTERDYEAEREWRLKNRKQLEGPKEKPKDMSAIVEKIGRELRAKGIVK